MSCETVPVYRTVVLILRVCCPMWGDIDAEGQRDFSSRRPSQARWTLQGSLFFEKIHRCYDKRLFRHFGKNQMRFPIDAGNCKNFLWHSLPDFPVLYGLARKARLVRQLCADTLRSLYAARFFRTAVSALRFFAAASDAVHLHLS